MYPERFNIEPTKKTPWVILEPGRIFIMGRSISENPGDFYRQVQEWISGYTVGYSGKTKIDLGFEYINTSSTKWIYLILKELSGIKDMARNSKITWYYEHGDDDMYELGFILRALVECPFTMVEVDNMNAGRYEKILAAPV